MWPVFGVVVVLVGELVEQRRACSDEEVRAGVQQKRRRNVDPGARARVLIRATHRTHARTHGPEADIAAQPDRSERRQREIGPEARRNAEIRRRELRLSAV